MKVETTPAYNRVSKYQATKIFLFNEKPKTYGKLRPTWSIVQVFQTSGKYTHFLANLFFNKQSFKISRL